MTQEFTELLLAETMEEIAVNRFVKKLPKKLYYGYLINKLPILRRGTNYLGAEANQWILPFTKEQISNDKQYLDLFMKKFINNYDLTHVYYTEDLSSYCRWGEEYCTLIKYIMIPEIVRSVCRSLNLSHRDLKLAVIDSGDRRIEYILELMIEDLNYLTIITDREEYFSAFKDMIYEDSGLVAEIIPKPIRESISSNLIIDLGKEPDKGYAYYRKDAVIIDVESSQEKRHYMYARGKQSKVLYNIDLAVHSNPTEINRLAAFLCCEDQTLRNFLMDTGRSYSANHFQKMKEEYDIRLRGLKYL